MIKNEIIKLCLAETWRKQSIDEINLLAQKYVLVFQKTEKNVAIWSSLKATLQKNEPNSSLRLIKNNVIKSIYLRAGLQAPRVECSTYVLYISKYESVRLLYEMFFADPKKSSLILLELLIRDTSLNSLQLAEQNKYYSAPLINLSFFK